MNKTFIFIALLFYVYGKVNAQQQMGAFLAYGPETRYLSTQNFAVLQSKYGYLWIGTQNGLVRFDGTHYKNYFANYTNPNSPTDNSIVDIVEDKNGHLWFCGFNYGLSKFDEQTGLFKQYKKPTADNFQFYGIFSGLKCKDGDLWFTTAGRGLAKYLYDKDSFVLFFPEPDKCKDGSVPGDNYITGICEDKNDASILWISSFKGLYAFNKTTKVFTHYPTGIKISYAADITINSCEADNAGNIWLATLGEGIMCFNTTSKKFVPEKSKKNPSTVNQVKLVNDSTLFAACFNEGLYQLSLNNAAYTNITPSGSASGNFSKTVSINKISVTADAGIFIGGNSYVYQLHPAFTRFKKNISYQDASPADYIKLNSFLWDDDRKQYWIATSYGNGLYTLKENEFIAKKIIADDKLPHQNNIFLTLAKDAKKRCWVLNYYSGIYLWNETKKTFERPGAGITPLPDSIFSGAKALQADSKGNIWMLSSNKFVFYDVLQNTFQTYPVIWDAGYTGQKNYSPAIIKTDPNDNAWLLTQSGLFVCSVKDKKVKHLFKTGNEQNSLPSALIAAGEFNKYNSFWIISGNSLHVYDWEKFNVLSSHTINDGLPSMNVRDIKADSGGRIWANTLAGLGLFDPMKKYWRTYNRFDGLENDYLDCKLFVTENEKIIIDQTHGFVLKDISEVGSSSNAPILRFTSIAVNDKEYYDTVVTLKGKVLNLPYNENNIAIEFAAMDWLYSFRTTYVFKIDGIPSSNTFSPIADNKIRLTSLAPGNYTVHIKALSGSGVWSNEIILLININKPFWQTAWFIALCIFFTGTIFYMIYRYRVNQLKKMQHMRNNIARDLHDEVGSTLTSIKILSEVSKGNIYKDQGKSSILLQKITEQSTAAQQGISDIVWAVKPENDKLENMVIRMREYVAHTLESKNIMTSIDIDEKLLDKTLGMSQRRDFLLIFREAINNIAKHAGASEVQIKLQKQHNDLQMQVTDNGKGFDEAMQTSSSGLKNMHSRAGSLKGILKITSSINKGTVVLLTMPTT